jgi:hypothetical protein
MTAQRKHKVSGAKPVTARPTARPGRFGFVHLVDAIAEHAKSARCENDLDRLVVLERMRVVFETEPEVLLRRGFDKAYRQVMEGV